MKLLLDYGADASITTTEGATPLMARWRWYLASRRKRWHERRGFRAVKICYSTATRWMRSTRMATPPARRAHRGSNDIVAFLIEKGAKLDVVDVIGWTPLTIAHGVLYPNTFNRRLETAELC